MATNASQIEGRRATGGNLWLTAGEPISVAPAHALVSKVLDSEEAVGQAMFDELVGYAEENSSGPINIVLLGGRGGQAMYRLINSRAETGDLDELLSRLNVFTQDALAPMRMDNALSFVTDFKRLLGEAFFSRVRSFTPMQTDVADLASSLEDYVCGIAELGGIDIFFLGLGPEAEAASHLCYIKPGAGARLRDVAGLIPISPSILEHHISKFKIGGSAVSAEDEAECRQATSILTLGPAAILSAKRIVQSIVDASTAPAKRASFRRLSETQMPESEAEIERAVDENPGLLVRLCSDVRTYVLADLFE